MRSARWFMFALSVTGTAAMGCGGSEDQIDGPVTFEEFRGLVYQEPDTGIYIYNGDETAEDLLELRSAYGRYSDSVNFARGIGTSRLPSIVNRVGGQDDAWSASTAQNLTYCIQRSSFTTSQYNSVVQAMNSATGAWEAAGRLNFVHNSSLDNNCNNRTNSVVFNVRRVSTNQYLARAFFPSYSRRSREILIATSSFGSIPPWTLTGVLRHELGHTIGLRHEHTRPDSGTCFEDNNWRALTAYDSDSVMHYPQCNGTNTGDLVLTAEDRAGAAALYP